ncbi:MAG TPA: hypothetical protein VF035_07365 [Longimicrobiales bacterium]
MKYILTLCAACAVILGAALNMEPDVPGFFAARTPIEYEIAQLRERGASLHRQHREYMLGDSLRRLLPAQNGVTAGVSPWMKDPADSILAVARANVADIDTVRARVGLFMVEDNYGQYPAARSFAATDFYLLFTGTDASGPYCIAAVSMRKDPRVRAPVLGAQRRGVGPIVRTIQEPLGGCRFWARYGAPGSSIDSWLRDGGYYFASRGVDAQTEPDTMRRRDLFGRARYLIDDARVEACLTHDDTACVDALLAPPWKVRPGAFAAYASLRYRDQSVFGRGDAALMAQVEKEFGPERFARFWTSKLPMEEAFADAFGVELEDWMHNWTEKWYGHRTAGPQLAAGTWLLSLAFITVLAVLSWVLARRRQIA